MPGIQCDSCKKWLKSKSAFRVVFNNKIISVLRQHKNFALQKGQKVCSACRKYAYRNLDTKNRSTSSSNIADSVEPSTSTKCEAEKPKVVLSLPRCHNSNVRCIICNSQKNLVTVPHAARTQTFIERGIYVTAGKRCCKDHLSKKVFTDASLADLKPITNNTHLYEKDIETLLQDIRGIAKKKGLDFDTPGQLKDSDYYSLMGLTIENFDKIFDLVKSGIHSSEYRSRRTCLAVLLVKLRTGLSNGVLSALFNLKKRLLAFSIQSARQALIKNFVPLYLGAQHITRTKIIEDHTRLLAKTLFIPDDNNETVVLVADGTYIYIQKSSNYSFQRRCYSIHKGRPLVKPMMLVTTTGYILDVFGPYFSDSKNNDANIFTHILKKDAHNIRDWLKPNDIIIVDRGFRDCLKLLEDMDLIPKMPSFINKQAQFVTKDANETRLVTKVRWVVEAVNGQLKNWRVLNNVIPNVQIPYIRDYVQIVCAILNAFHPTRINSDEDDNIIAQRMLDLVKKPNHLQKTVEENGWARKKAIWRPLSESDLSDFPQLTWEELRNLTLGIYQLKQSRSYTQEHISQTGMYSLYVHREDVSVIRIQLRSRHTSSKIYNMWIRTAISPMINIEWYCQCKVGARVVGCCAHVASVLWYLGYWRHNRTETKTPSLEYANTFEDAATGWSSDDSDNQHDEEA